MALTGNVRSLERVKTWTDSRVASWQSGSVSFGWDTLQRLYSTFANGLPGKGLFVLRLLISTFLVYACWSKVWVETGQVRLAVPLIAALGGLFLLAGLWTPFAGALVALMEVWMAFSSSTEWQAAALAAGIATAVMLLGPGSWSVDARIYGRKRISIQVH
jgi:putative oxidoreductase